MPPEAWNLLIFNFGRQETLDYMRFNAMITAILTAGRMARGEDGGDHLKTALREYKALAFPEINNDLTEKARHTEKILEEEFSKGPLKVQALDYDKKRKKKPR